MDTTTKNQDVNLVIQIYDQANIHLSAKDLTNCTASIGSCEIKIEAPQVASTINVYDLS